MYEKFADVIITVMQLASAAGVDVERAIGNVSFRQIEADPPPLLESYNYFLFLEERGALTRYKRTIREPIAITIRVIKD